eukprot:gnl/MRDRNA2_/MRDRNA2_142169_c0_seq1.p1 gnl/MRDRNA2_/MRDRNA2_142169_c0~~gnl/MRDRNA2_/MRDRNA2_142169_c0_seq1.p1  ORF type:complete len:346 (+),score=57.73 gnl/MRDRNA2_/MRDRNA2_142169_c0_seq1:144-1040(+)
MAAEQMTKIFGTEEDPINCAIFYRVGVCRNADKCTRKHNRPTSGQTIILLHMYTNPPEALMMMNDEPWDDEMYDKAQAHLELFYKETFLELAEYGEIEDMIISDNISDHLLGNVWVKYYFVEDAEKALHGLLGRYYCGKLIQAELTNVTDFREGRCRAHHGTRCTRNAACKFLHIKHIPKAIKRRVAMEMYEEHPEYKDVEPGSNATVPYDPEDNSSHAQRYDDGSYPDWVDRDRDRDRDRRRDRDRDRDRDRKRDDYDPLDPPEVAQGRGGGGDRDRRRSDQDAEVADDRSKRRRRQ